VFYEVIKTGVADLYVRKCHQKRFLLFLQDQVVVRVVVPLWILDVVYIDQTYTSSAPSKWSAIK
jgi:hypothetical protein